MADMTRLSRGDIILFLLSGPDGGGCINRVTVDTLCEALSFNVGITHNTVNCKLLKAIKALRKKVKKRWTKAGSLNRFKEQNQSWLQEKFELPVCLCHRDSSEDETDSNEINLHLTSGDDTDVANEV